MFDRIQTQGGEMKEVSRTILRDADLQRSVEAVRKGMVATRIQSHRLMCAGRIFKKHGKICLQAY